MLHGNDLYLEFDQLVELIAETAKLMREIREEKIILVVEVADVDVELVEVIR